MMRFSAPADLFGEHRRLPDDVVAFVDPGLMGTGCALWENLATGGAPTVVDRWTPSRGMEWQDKIDGALEWFETWLSGTGTDILVVIEAPELWTGSAKSMSSASSGKLFKLAYLVGGMIQLCRARYCEWLLVSPRDWKGQLPKAAMKKRVREALGKTYREHEWDAVGIGLAAQGRL